MKRTRLHLQTPSNLRHPLRKDVKGSKILVSQKKELFTLTRVCLQNLSSNCDIAKAWGVELAKLAPNQQINVQKAINNILFEERLNNFHRDSVTIRNAGTCYRPNRPG